MPSGARPPLLAAWLTVVLMFPSRRNDLRTVFSHNPIVVPRQCNSWLNPSLGFTASTPRPGRSSLEDRSKRDPFREGSGRKTRDARLNPSLSLHFSFSTKEVSGLRNSCHHLLPIDPPAEGGSCLGSSRGNLIGFSFVVARLHWACQIRGGASEIPPLHPSSSLYPELAGWDG